MTDFSILPAVILMLSILAAFLGALGAGAVAIARWARRAGRRPWLWVVGTYVAINVAIGLIQLVVRGPR